MHHLYDPVRTHVWNWVTCVWQWRMIPYETWVGMRHLVAALIVVCTGGAWVPAIVVPPPVAQIIPPFPPAWSYTPPTPESWYPSGSIPDLGGPIEIEKGGPDNSGGPGGGFGDHHHFATSASGTPDTPTGPIITPPDLPIIPHTPVTPVSPVSEPVFGSTLLLMTTGLLAYLRRPHLKRSSS